MSTETRVGEAEAEAEAAAGKGQGAGVLLGTHTEAGGQCQVTETRGGATGKPGKEMRSRWFTTQAGFFFT